MRKTLNAELSKVTVYGLAGIGVICLYISGIVALVENRTGNILSCCTGVKLGNLCLVPVILSVCVFCGNVKVLVSYVITAVTPFEGDSVVDIVRIPFVGKRK